MTNFIYDDNCLVYLSQRCPKMAYAIDQFGRVDRRLNPDVFGELVRSILAQQISYKAAKTLWARLDERLGGITPEALCLLPADELQQLGTTHKKAGYIKAIAEQVATGRVDLTALAHQSDEETIKILTNFAGVGEWTAQMLMIFSLNRLNVLSKKDLAVLRGLRMLYRHRVITPALFQKYQRRFAPYNTVASFYLWEIASGKLGLEDPAKK